jgi:hypothetical protein
MLFVLLNRFSELFEFIKNKSPNQINDSGFNYLFENINQL